MASQHVSFPPCKAQWIWAPRRDNEAEPPAYFVLFRRSFILNGPIPTSCMVHVSADTRYRLFVNGSPASFGPCKSYPTRWYYDSVDIASFLKKGVNIIAVRVLRLSPENPAATSILRTSKPGLILHCSVGADISVDSDESWKSRRDESVQLVPNSEWDFRLGPPFVSLWERGDGRLAAQHWLDADFDDAEWINAVPSTMAAKMSPILDSRKLCPRPIPALPEIPAAFDSVTCCSGSGGPTKSEWEALIASSKPVRIDSRATVTVDLESSELTTGFLELCMDQDGEDAATVTILASECYEGDMDQGSRSRAKGNRANSQNGKLYGPTDTYVCRPRKNTYEPFWWRAFRYVRLTIQTARSPLTIRFVRYRATHYPLDVEAALSSSSSPTFDKLWRISLNTLRNCMHETYEDCPYYEQNQFIMDSRLQMLFTYAVSRDDRLARKTLHEFHASRREDGLLEAQFPAPCRMTAIPAFSLYWVLMVHDHMRHFGDAGLVRQYLGTVDGILDHFSRLVGPLGLVGRFAGPEDETWAFVDWVPEWRTPEYGFKGVAVPPAYFSCGAATVHSLLYAIALRSAADLAECCGRKCVAGEYRSRAEELNAAARQHCFDQATGLFTDGPGSAELSQHTQVLAVLSGAVHAGEAAALMRRTVLDRERYGVVRTSLAMAFYVFRAASLAGVYEELWSELMKPWQVMMDQHLTTWAEFETNPRSDCHGWSATPMYEIVREVVGVKIPSDDTSAPVVLEPRPRMINALSGSFLVGGGRRMDVSWSDGSLSLTTSDDMVVELRLGNETRQLALGKGVPLQTLLKAQGS